MPEPGAFHVIGGQAVRAILQDCRDEIVALVRRVYLAHHDRRTINPDSYFLRFPDKPSARIIALPARLQDERDVAGIKWISSFPTNHALGKQRASAAVILNDMSTGFPYACLEGSEISAARTAASAVLGAHALHQSKQVATMAVVGAGPIAATIVDFLLATGWSIGRVRVHDLIPQRAEMLSQRLRERGCAAEATSTAADAIADGELVLFATTSAAPYLDDPALFTAKQTLLHISLRDLGVRVILSSQNFVDDVEHCLKAQTSLHLAEQETGARKFVAGTIADLLSGRMQPDGTRARIFSPFGLGVLDIALAQFVYDKALARGSAMPVPGFFPA